jgi:hypothetical protein
MRDQPVVVPPLDPSWNRTPQAQATLTHLLARMNLMGLTGAEKMPLDVQTLPDGNVTRRDFLVTLFQELKFQMGAEIGVETGLFSEQILSGVPTMKRLYSIDAWSRYRGYRDHVDTEKLAGFEAAARERLAPFGKRSSVVKGFSMDVVRDLPHGSLDFVYIDGNHTFDFVMADILEWSKRVRSGGIVAGHDYIRRPSHTVHVVYACQAYTYSHRITPWFLIGGATNDTRSFFWVKP